MNINKIKTEAPFNKVFPIDQEILKAISYHMEMNGYDVSFPIVLWKGKDIVIDGHTRLIAARDLGIDDVPVSLMHFDTEYEALQHAIHNQRDRRNATAGDIVRWVELVDELKPKGGDRKSADVIEKHEKSKLSNDKIDSVPSHVETAKVVGTSPVKVSKVREIIKNPEVRTLVDQGKLSIGGAYKKVQEEKKSKVEVTKSTFNETNDNIEWAQWTWNPVTGCEHGCEYCYARDIAIRFNGGFKPEFHKNRLMAPKNTKLPKDATMKDRGVFVCSMADLFGDWVPQEWIDSVMSVVRESPVWNFIFLTKNPERYLDIIWPKNSWVGATIDNQVRTERTIKAFKAMTHKPNVLFISFEPLSSEITFSENDLKEAGVNWLIIGGRSKSSKMPEGQPEWPWVEKLIGYGRKAGCSIYFKPNLTIRPKEYPQ